MSAWLDKVEQDLVWARDNGDRTAQIRLFVHHIPEMLRQLRAQEPEVEEISEEVEEVSEEVESSEESGEVEEASEAVSEEAEEVSEESEEAEEVPEEE